MLLSDFTRSVQGNDDNRPRSALSGDVQDLVTGLIESYLSCPLSHLVIHPSFLLTI